MTSEPGVDAGGDPTGTVSRASRPTTQPESVVITAEIPAFTPRRSSRRADASAPPRADAADELREPAPPALRAVVWLLFALVLIGIVGLAVEHFHSGWLSFLRDTAQQSPRDASGGATKAVSGSGFSRTSSGTHGATYTVPTASSYEVVIATNNRCFASVKSPPASSTYVFASTITPQQSPKTIDVSGSAAVVLDAHAASLEVRVGGNVVGTIATPTPFYTYTFVPSGH